MFADVDDADEPQIRPETVKIMADAIGISSLGTDAASELADDCTFRLSLLLQEAKKFRDRGRRRKLIADDFDRALKLRNLEPLYGLSTSDYLPFRQTSGGGRDIFFHEDKEIDLSTIINSHTPKAPLEMSVKAHWLAIDGVQPAIPENPILNFNHEGPSVSGNLADTKKDPDTRRMTTELVNVKNVTTHDLTIEQQLYYKEITEACVGADEPRRVSALHSIRTDTGLQAILARFCVFIAEGIRTNVANKCIPVLLFLIRMTKQLVYNPAVNLKNQLHELLPGIVTCLVGKNLSQNGDDANSQRALRDQAADLLKALDSKYNNGVNNLHARILKILTNVLKNERGSFESHYGALGAFIQYEVPELTKTIVIPLMPSISERLSIYSGGINQSDKLPTPANLLRGQCEKLLEKYIRSDPDVQNSLKDIADYCAMFGDYIGRHVFYMMRQSGNLNSAAYLVGGSGSSATKILNVNTSLSRSGTPNSSFGSSQGRIQPSGTASPSFATPGSRSMSVSNYSTLTPTSSNPQIQRMIKVVKGPESAPLVKGSYFFNAASGSAVSRTMSSGSGSTPQISPVAMLERAAAGGHVKAPFVLRLAGSRSNSPGSSTHASLSPASSMKDDFGL